jgi:hypothetical protein
MRAAAAIITRRRLLKIWSAFWKQPKKMTCPGLFPFTNAHGNAEYDALRNILCQLIDE